MFSEGRDQEETYIREFLQTYAEDHKVSVTKKKPSTGIFDGDITKQFGYIHERTPTSQEKLNFIVHGFHANYSLSVHRQLLGGMS